MLGLLVWSTLVERSQLTVGQPFELLLTECSVDVQLACLVEERLRWSSVEEVLGCLMERLWSLVEEVLGRLVDERLWSLVEEVLGWLVEERLWSLVEEVLGWLVDE